MDKIILVDGNNLLFRSYYATAYNGNFMKNSKGFPTNALFGFTNMINKIILEEKPSYMLVAFDKGKTFRHEKYKDYKGGRIETPDELKLQFPKAKELLTAMGIKYYEIDNYEADDIIGTFAKYCDIEDRFIGTIISSDKDLLQLISDDVDIKLLKQKDYIRYNKESFISEYGIVPDSIRDLKGLMGDSSDNIPGVRGIGEKTALKLLQEYKTIENLYDNIDNIKGKTKEKLLEDKDNAFFSKELATIYKDVPVDIFIDDIIYKGNDSKKLNDLYEDLEFYSFIKKSDETAVDMRVKILDSISEINLSEAAIYLEMDGTNYHKSNIIGLGVYSKEDSFFIPYSLFKDNYEWLKNIKKYTYDIKRIYVALRKHDISLGKYDFDTMLAAYLLDYNLKDDIAYLAREFNYLVSFNENIYNKKKESSIDVIAYNAILKAKFIYETKDILESKLKNEELMHLYTDIEVPLTYTLGDMEYNGVVVSKDILLNMKEEINIKLDIVSEQIYNQAGEKFNISSPKELSYILYEKLNLPHGKKGKIGYSTAQDVLNKLLPKHPIIKNILEYRVLSKLNSTYIEGMIDVIYDDGKVHTIYNQALTRTGRLSSIEPNLQNIPIRYEYGRLIRKAFLPSPNSIILSADYSQIELRILADMANDEVMINAFNNDEDIHSKTASDIFHMPVEAINKNQRRIAKAVNFGIVYGISGFGLSENLDISIDEAKKFINDYLNTYPGIKEYMDNTIAHAKEMGYVRTLFGRKRTIDELRNTNYMIREQGSRMALNTPIQGTSADIIKKAMIEIDNEFKKQNIKSKMIIQVHDELVFDVLICEKEKVIDIVKNIMENTYKLDVPLKVDIEYGCDWYQAK